MNIYGALVAAAERPVAIQAAAVRRFEGARTDLAEGRVTAPLVIEHLDAIEQAILAAL